MINFGGGQLPSFGQRPQMGGQQQMQPLGQMWQQPQQQRPTGQLPPMGQGPQMQPGMVPGVPGSMGLNPGMGGPIQGQQQMNGPAGAMQGQYAGFPIPQRPNGGGGFGQFMQSAPFQSMMQSPEAQQFLQGNPKYQRFMSPGGGPLMRPMGA